MSEWQPIETAPKDGKEFLAMAHFYGAVVVYFDYLDEKFSCGFDDSGFFDTLTLTHWMPLPPPPTKD